MSTTQTQQPGSVASEPSQERVLVVFGHSGLFYWWTVWIMGYIMALLTSWQGKPYVFENDGVVKEVLINPSGSLGVIFTVVFVLVILMTNLTVRGIASFLVITVILGLTFAFAYFDLWNPIIKAMGHLAIFMNLGFYVFFSTAVLILWLISFFIYDRLEYWTFRPGQMIHHQVFGSGEQVYDTIGLSINKLRNDLFRHWILGLGSGDMEIATTGARKAAFLVKNVLFVGVKMQRIQEMIATKPDQIPEANAEESY